MQAITSRWQQAQVCTREVEHVDTSFIVSEHVNCRGCPGVYGSVVHGASLADLLCVNHAVYEGDDRLTMALAVDKSATHLVTNPFHFSPGIRGAVRSVPLTRIIDEYM